MNILMKKKTAFLLLLFYNVITPCWAYHTEGTGENYSLYRLSQTEGSGVTMEIRDGTFYYTLNENDTISAGDHFQCTETCVVQFADGIVLVVEGTADFQGQRKTFTATEGANSAVGICLNDTPEATNFGNCTFIGVGVKYIGKSSGSLYACTFTDNNGNIGQSALVLGNSDTPYTISHCRFTNNPKAAIASAANIPSLVTIEDSEFLQNGTANGNTPQLNLTASSMVAVKNCDIVGDSEHTMVGGIGVSNFFATEGTDITIYNCRIRENRYGIGTVGPMSIRIEKNDLINNCHEVNPMNGGSGISLYDPYGQTEAILTGNYIEGSLWGITVIGCKKVNLGWLEKGGDYNPGGNVFKDNGNNGQLYDLYNNSANTVYAQANTWNVNEQTEEQIETVIFHKNDNPSLGEVIFWPAANTTDINRMHTHIQDADVYDLQGHKTAVRSKGIYIINGKKVVR